MCFLSLSENLSVAPCEGEDQLYQMLKHVFIPSYLYVCLVTVQTFLDNWKYIEEYFTNCISRGIAFILV